MNKISVVISGRNDNYDGNFEDRLAIALARNIRTLPEAEFIFVEWNPYLDRPLTCTNLKKIFGGRVKYFVVHPDFHDEYCHIDGFLEYPPKNVGIRKAMGDYIVCTNSDIVFSPEVANALRGPGLKENTVYRATRVDISPEYLDVTFPVLSRYKLAINRGLTNAGGDFLMLHKNLWDHITGYCEEFPEQRLHKDAQIIHMLVKDQHYPWEDLGVITHWRHPSSWSSTHNRPKVGDIKWDFTKSGYTVNKDTWGLTHAREEIRDDITWLLKG